jgi:hypothetical protein
VGNSIPIKAEIKRGFLRQICAGAKANAATLGEALLGFQAAIFTANFQRGKILVSTSGSGQSGSFEIGMNGKGFTQENVFGMAEQFLTLLSVAVDPANGNLPDTGLPADTDALFAYMSADDLFQAVTEQLGDWSNLNTYATGTAAGAPA